MFTLARNNWAKDTRGGPAVLLALCLIPLMLLVAMAVDSTRQITTNQHLQSAVDAAALAGARAMEDGSWTDAEVKQIALDSYKANLLTRHRDVTCPDATVTLDADDSTVKVEADCTLPTLFGAPLTPATVGVSNAAVAKPALSNLDLALMLDVSGSMNATKMNALKTAAITTANKLITPETGDRVRISFVSYSYSVNAGAYGNAALGRAADDDSDGDGVDKVCVSERTGVAAWSDDKPEAGKWVGDQAVNCPNSSLLPLTTDLTAFEAAINGLTGLGGTAGHLGVAWAWYLIAPDWDSIWPTQSAPRSYTEPNTIKAVILMTDGRFNREYEPTTQGSSATQAKKLCEKMREKKILVYAVAFRAPAAAENTLRACAGDDSRFFDANDSAALLAAYAAIASQLTSLAIVE